jgi:nucleoside-diphosphate-sugar epimerase
MGNIGKYVVSDLLRQGYGVVSLDIQNRRNELDDMLLMRGLKPSRAHSTFAFIQGDIRNETLMNGLIGGDNFRISGIVAFCLDNQVDCRDVNVRGTLILLGCVEKFSALSNQETSKQPWFTFTSSREIDGSDCTHKHPCDENSASNPSNLYGETKWQAERQIKETWSQHQNSIFSGYAILRLASVYGGAYDLQERLIPSLAINSMRGDVIDLNGGGQIFDFVHITDVVASIVKAAQVLEESSLQRNAQPKEEFLICSGESNSAIKVLEHITKFTDSNSYVNMAPVDTRYPSIFVCNNRKMKEQLVSSLAYPHMDDGLATYMLSLQQRTMGILQQNQAFHASLEDFLREAVNVVLVRVRDKTSLLPNIADAFAPIWVEVVQKLVKVAVVGEDHMATCD